MLPIVVPGFFAGGGDTWQPMQAPPPPIPSACQGEKPPYLPVRCS